MVIELIRRNISLPFAPGEALMVKHSFMVSFVNSLSELCSKSALNSGFGTFLQVSWEKVRSDVV